MATTRTVSFLLSSNPTNLAAALEGKASATVEAEYGDVTVKGSILTMAHHGKNAGNPAPCSYDNKCGEGVEVVGISHFDLDTLGGAAAIIGTKPESELFWKLAEFVDLNGAHKLSQSGANEADLRRLHAFWAWSDSCRVYAPRDGSVVDVTDKILEGVNALEKILADDEDLLQAGDKRKADGEKLNVESFVEVKDDVIVRKASGFTNHLYTTPDGKVCKAVVAYDERHGSVTVSFADGPVTKTAREIVQQLWGELAGGHAGIAGSPREQRMSESDLYAAADLTAQSITVG